MRRWDSACQKLPDANLALISVAGEYAAELANQALDRNLNVMMFSDNVTLEDEIQLKTRAREKRLAGDGAGLRYVDDCRHAAGFLLT